MDQTCPTLTDSAGAVGAVDRSERRAAGKGWDEDATGGAGWLEGG